MIGFRLGPSNFIAVKADHAEEAADVPVVPIRRNQPH
jgi:hypothetical protein